MKSSHYIIAFTILSLSFQSLFSQEKEISVEQVLQNESIDKQFDIVIKKSGRYQEYKVIKQVWVNKLQSNVADTLKTLESKINTSTNKINQQKEDITKYKEELAKTNENLIAITQEKDSMSFFGSMIKKSSYNTIILLIISTLIAFLGLFIYKFKKSNTVTKQAKKALLETEEEYENHRRRSLEREQKIMRKLQDEINKQRKAGA